MQENELGKRVQQILEAGCAEGAPFSFTEAEDILALALLSTPTASRPAASTDVIDLLGRFSARIGFERGMPVTSTRARIVGYLKAHPLHTALMRVLAETVLDVLRAGSHDKARAAARALGSEAAPTRPLNAGTRPQGTIQAGPLAAFQAAEKKP